MPGPSLCVTSSFPGADHLVYTEEGELKSRKLDGTDEQTIAEVGLGVTVAVTNAGETKNSEFLSFFDGISAEDGDWAQIDWFGVGWANGEAFPWIYHLGVDLCERIRRN